MKTKKVVILGLALVMIAATATGCVKIQKVAPAEAKAEAVAEAKAEAPAETVAETEAVAQEKTYESKDGWKMKYFPQQFDVKEESDGAVTFEYKGESSGKDFIKISYHKNKMPSEILYEKVADIPDERVKRDEGWFASTYPAWTYSREVAPGKDDPNQRRTLTAIEHNGGSLLVDIVYAHEENDDLNMDKSDQISGTIDTLELVNHKPQEELAYRVGTYERKYKEEIEGEEQTVTDTITLNEDHTGVMSFQDDINIIWTSTEIITESGDQRYEFTVEGDNLMINMNPGEEWLTFERKK